MAMYPTMGAAPATGVRPLNAPGIVPKQPNMNAAIGRPQVASPPSAMTLPGTNPTAAKPVLGGRLVPGTSGGTGVPTQTEMPTAAGTATHGSAPTAPPTMQDFLARFFGENNPFGDVHSLYGDPMQATADFAQRELQKSLAGIGASSAASGLGWSGRRGLAEGEAVAGSNAALGKELGQLSMAQQQADRDRALQASLGAYGVANQQNALATNQLDALTRAGGGLLDFQNTEGLGPLLNFLLPILTGFGSTTSNPDVFTRTGK